MCTQIFDTNNDNTGIGIIIAHVQGCIHSAFGQGHHTPQSKHGRQPNNWANPQLILINIMSQHEGKHTHTHTRKTHTQQTNMQTNNTHSHTSTPTPKLQQLVILLSLILSLSPRFLLSRTHEHTHTYILTKASQTTRFSHTHLHSTLINTHIYTHVPECTHINTVNE